MSSSVIIAVGEGARLMRLFKVRNFGKMDSNISTFCRLPRVYLCELFGKKIKQGNFKHQFYSIFLTSPHLSADGVALLGLPRGLQNMPHKIRHFKHRATSAAFEEHWPIYACTIAISKCVQGTWALNASLSRLSSAPSLGARRKGKFVCNISQRLQITFKQQYKHKFMIIHEPDPPWEN